MIGYTVGPHRLLASPPLSNVSKTRGPMPNLQATTDGNAQFRGVFYSAVHVGSARKFQFIGEIEIRPLGMRIVTAYWVALSQCPLQTVSNGICMLEFIAGLGGLIGLAVCLLVLRGYFDD
jgi:hypothetical protein